MNNAMPIELTPLQQHCLKGIGISLWQLRNTPQQPVLLETSVAESTCAYHSDNKAIDEPKSLISQLEAALAYVKHQQGIKHDIRWKTSAKCNTVRFDEHRLLLPPLAEVFSSHRLKKQLWTLLSSDLS